MGVDKRIDWYTIYHGNIWGVAHNWAEFHTFTRWNDYCDSDERDRGMDLSSDWMVYEYGHCVGRRPDPHEELTEEDFITAGCFRTKEEAFDALREKAKARLDFFKSDTEMIEAALEDAKEGKLLW